MSKKNYRIYMKGIDDLEEGWFCGSGARCNSVFHRSDEKRDADVFNDTTALLFCIEFRGLGYPCKVKPKISQKRKLKILGLI